MAPLSFRERCAWFAAGLVLTFLILVPPSTNGPRLSLTTLADVTVSGAQGAVDQAVRQAVRQASASSPAQKVVPASVPDRYQTLVAAALTSCPALPAAVFAAQLRQESGWNRHAVSPAGAQGIAQFMPGTWRAHGVDGNHDGKADPFDPADALPAAAAYDCLLLRQVGQLENRPLAAMLAAYNAGPGAVQRYHGVPPYRETQHYVTTILERAGMR